MTRTDLIAKLEAASEGSRELDAGLYVETHEPMFGRYWSPNASDDPGDPYMAQKVTAPNYTTSIDAALQLVETNLPPSKSYGKTDTGEGWKIGFYRSPYTFEGNRWWDVMIRDHAEEGVTVKARTLPLALCIALLRTLEAEEAAEKALAMGEDIP